MRTAVAPTPQPEERDDLDRPPPPARGVRARVWGGAGLSDWKLPEERQRRGGLKLVRFVGLGVGAAFAGIAAVLGASATELGVVFVAGFPVAAVGLALMNLRSREVARDCIVVLEEDHVRFEGGTAPIVLPLARVAALHLHDAPRSRAVRVTLHLTDGPPAHIVAPMADVAPLVEALDRRLGSALTTPGLRLSLLRQGRSLAEWRAALQRLTGSGGYRGGSLPAEELTAAVQDDRLGAEERIAAALALGGRSASEQREKLRIAVQEARTTALRVALDRAADGTLDEADIARAAEEEASRGER